MAVTITLAVPSGTLECRAVLLDMDGVLVDSLPLIELQLRQWARRHGLQEEQVVAASPGRTNKDLISIFAPHLDIVDETRRLMELEIATAAQVQAAEGALRLVKGLPASSWAVVTSGDRRVAEARLVAAGLPAPPILVAAEDVRCGKPDPQGYRQAAQRLDVRPEECVVIEDAPAGLQAAAAAGMRAVAVAPSTPDIGAPYEHVVTTLALVRVRGGGLESS